jgi:hypothetical protein
MGLGQKAAEATREVESFGGSVSADSRVCLANVRQSRRWLRRTHKRAHMRESVTDERDRLLEAMRVIADFGTINLARAWEHELRDVIRSCVDRAREKVRKSEEAAAAAPERIHATGNLKAPWSSLTE